MKRATKVIVGFATVALATGSLTAWKRTSHAADHLDPPARVDPDHGGMDRAADIADVFAWHQGDGANRTLVTALTFAGPNAPVANQAIPCDRNVLYSIYIDNTGDAVPDVSIRVRFAQDELNHCFVRFEGLPGASSAVDGRVDAVINAGTNIHAYAGLRDDAFFFDLQGFRETLAMGTIRMTNDRDFFAHKNTPAIVIELPYSAVSGTAPQIRIWATTGRVTG